MLNRLEMVLWLLDKQVSNFLVQWEVSVIKDKWKIQRVGDIPLIKPDLLSSPG